MLLQHTNLVCVVSFLLKRPCLLNISPRDPYNNWGSFINEKTYHWDPAVVHDIPEYANELEALIRKLPQTSDAIWGDAIQEADYDKSKSQVFPMNKKFVGAEWEKAVEYYSGTNPAHGNQVLVSPNWGDAWVIPESIFPELYDCNFQVLTSTLQNAMYGPTTLTWQLHQERYERADATVWNPEGKAALYEGLKNTVAPQQGLLNAAVLTGPHLSATTGTKEGVPTYGTIHMRTYMITRGQPDQQPMATDKLADAIATCMEKAKELIGDPNFPTNWWFLADNAPTAVEVADEFRQRQANEQTQADWKIPVLRVFHDYEEVAAKQLEQSGGVKVDRNQKGYLASSHSLSKDAIGLYGHANMAGSIQDWMALHESKISIVTGGTSYGTTGSRGHGKTTETFCGPPEQPRIFKILLKKKDSSEKA
jgi:hypothetical protein